MFHPSKSLEMTPFFDLTRELFDECRLKASRFLRAQA
jgi:hypothetical protein